MEYGDFLSVRIGTAEIVLDLEEYCATAHLPSHVRSVAAQEMLVRLQNVRHAHLEALVDVRRPDVLAYGVNPQLLSSRKAKTTHRTSAGARANEKPPAHWLQPGREKSPVPSQLETQQQRKRGVNTPVPAPTSTIMALWPLYTIMVSNKPIHGKRSDCLPGGSRRALGCGTRKRLSLVVRSWRSPRYGHHDQGACSAPSRTRPWISRF